MAVIRSFRDLDVYKLAREQARNLFAVSKSFPKEERFSLTDQIRRSSRAVNA
jgi:four helix bundle protein